MEVLDLARVDAGRILQDEGGLGEVRGGFAAAPGGGGSDGVGIVAIGEARVGEVAQGDQLVQVVLEALQYCIALKIENFREKRYR